MPQITWSGSGAAYLARQGGSYGARFGQHAGNLNNGTGCGVFERFARRVLHKVQRGHVVLFPRLLTVVMPAGIQRQGVGAGFLMLTMVRERAERQRPVAQAAAAQHRQKQHQQKRFEERTHNAPILPCSARNVNSKKSRCRTAFFAPRAAQAHVLPPPEKHLLLPLNGCRTARRRGIRAVFTAQSGSAYDPPITLWMHLTDSRE